MTQDHSVTTSSNTLGKLNQWTMGIFYRKEGAKETLDLRRIRYIGVAVLFVLIIFILVNTSDENFMGLKPVEPPDNLVAGNSMEFSTAVYSAAGYSKNENLNETKKKPKKIIRYGAPAMISRPGILNIPPGTFVKAVLSTGASNGPVKARVSESFSQNGERLVRIGSTLLGQGSSTEDRLFIRFNRMVTKEGAVQTIQAQAVDKNDEQIGLKGSKLGSAALKLAGAIGLNFVGAFSEGLQENEVQNGVALKKASLKNALLNGAAKASLELSKETMEDLKNGRPVIQVPKGREIFILFEGSGE